MANMGYCRFRNTLSDLHDCEEHLYDTIDDEEESEARIRLVKLCMRVAAEFEDEDVDQFKP